MKKPALISPNNLPPETARVLRPIVETLNDLTGIRSGEIAHLASDASLMDITAKINELIARLNGSGA